MPLNRANNVIFGTATNYALPNQSLLDPLQRWYGLSSNSLTINPYGYITGTGNYGTSNTISPHFDINGNFTVNFAYVVTELQTNTLKIGTSNNTENYISFRGTTGDEPGNFTHTFIGERLYGGTENSELLLFKGNDIEGVSGPDRIRLFANNHVFDTYTVNAVSGTFASVGATGQAVTRMIIKENGNIGIGTITPNTIATSSTPAMLGIVSNAVGTTGLVVRATASQTANLQEWQDSAGSIKVYVNQNGVLGTNAGTYFAGGGGYVTQIISSTATTVPLLAKGHPSQTANLQEWQDSAGAVLTSVTPSGRLWVKSIVEDYATLQVKAYTSGASAANFAGVGGTAEVVIIKPGAAVQTGLVIRGYASQTANLQEWQDSAGTVVATVSNTGTVRSSVFANLTPALTYIATNYDTQGVGIVITNSAYKGLIVRGAASQTTNLQEWQDSAGSILARISSSGGLALYGQLYVSSATTTSAIITTGAANVTPLKVDGYYGQTANLQEWRSTVGGTVLASITSAGIIDLTGASGTTPATGTSAGDKISIYGQLYGIGLQSNRMVAYVDTSAAFSIRPVSNTGNKSSGGDSINLFSNGNVEIKNSTSVPAANSSIGGYLYVEGGALKYRGSSGTVTTIANA